MNDKEAPVIVMLHGKSGNKIVWEKGVGGIQGLAETLHKQKFAVITVDLRKHGKSKYTGPGKASTRINPRRDYMAIVLGDLETVKNFIYLEHQKGNLNMRKTGIVASDMMTPLACMFAVNDWNKNHGQTPRHLPPAHPAGRMSGRWCCCLHRKC